MCNAIQQRMVEEAVVQKEVYDAMMNMRTRLNTLFGQPTPTPENVDLPDILPDVPPVDGEQPAATGRPTGYRSLSPNQVPSDVLAAADVSRKRSTPAKQPVKPYIPPTLPKENGNPFPGLSGPMG